MTDEALFYRRFVDDVRSFIGARAPASVAEIERRTRLALCAPPEQRDRRWAAVVAAISELLAGRDDRSAAAARLRAFVRENADLGRPRDVAISDFRFVERVDGILAGRDAQRYLVFAPISRAPLASTPPPGNATEAAPRRLAEWAVYALFGSAVAAAFWFAFFAAI